MTNNSFLSKIAEFILKKTKPDYMDSQEQIELFLANKKDDEFKSIFHTEIHHDMKIVSFGNDYDTSHVILYIHGGAYVNQLNYQHTIYCYILSKILKTRVVAPVYPLAPEHNYKETYKLIYKLYNDLSNEYEHITMMGDSAGGGFVLGFSQYLNTTYLKQADNIIVFSPWVDISMKNNYCDKNDPILGNVGLREIGKIWSNENTYNYKVSPIYGDNHDLPRTLVIVGSNEIFYQDVKKYYEKLVNDNVDSKLIVGEDLFHIYPLFPIPEAIKILKEIKKEINKIK